MPWADVDFDPFAPTAPRAPPRTSLTITPDPPPPPTDPNAPIQQTQPKAAPWSKEVDHVPDFSAPSLQPSAPAQEEPAGPPPGFLETAKRAGEAFDADIHRQRTAASQGTTPILEAHEKNLISDNVMEGDDGNLHYIDSEGRLQPTDTNKHVALPGNDGKIRVYARTPETDEGRASAAGRLLATGMGADRFRTGLKAPMAGTRVLGVGSRELSPAVHPDWIPPANISSQALTAANSRLIHPGWFPKASTSTATEAAERLGVDVPRAIASDSGNVHYAGQVLKGLPGGAPLRHAIEEGLQGEKGLQGALTRTGEMAGGVADVRTAGEGVTTGLEGNFTKESQKLVKALYDRVDALVDPNKTAPLTNVMNKVSEILSKRIARGNNELGKAVEEVSGALQRPGGLTYEGMKEARTALGELLKKTPDGMSKSELKAIYGALSEDLKNAAEVTGGPAAKAAWEKANTLARTRKETLDVLDKALGPESRSDEGVMNTLHNMAKTGAGADVKTLGEVKKALQGIPGILPGSPGSWENVASTIISRLGQDNKGAFSPTLFLRDYNQLSPAAKRMLFHGVGKGDVLGALDDIATISDKYNRAGKLANTSGTAGHMTATVATLEAISEAFHGNYGTPIAMLAGLIGSSAASRVLGNSGTVKSVARWTRTVDALAETPGRKAFMAYNQASRALAGNIGAAVGDPSLAPYLTNQLQGAARRPNERQSQQSQ